MYLDYIHYFAMKNSTTTNYPVGQRVNAFSVLINICHIVLYRNCIILYSHQINAFQSCYSHN